MARREDHHRQHHHQPQLHYVSILPSTTNEQNYNDQHFTRRSNDQERAKALYIDFEDAFQDESTNHDYFGFQPPEHSHQPANFYLQSVETISEVKNTNFSSHMRYHVSRESSRSSTPLNIAPFQPQYHQRINPSSLLHHHHPYTANSHGNLNNDFANLNVNHTTDNKEIPAPFTPDAIRFKIKQQETLPNSSSQLKLILPQYFLVKYLGRTPCVQLWGAQAVRSPIDDMVRNARQLSSVNEVPTLEACVNLRGLTLTHRHSPTRSKYHQPLTQHGLIPLENISYVMHDVKYSKIASCIVLRQSKISSTDHNNTNETVTECYAFLFQSREHAHRFALALAEAFNAQKQSVRASRQNHDDKREGRSPQRRSRHRNGHHHHERTRTNGKYDENYFRDSEV